jgi:hypothetical protein
MFVGWLYGVYLVRLVLGVTVLKLEPPNCNMQTSLITRRHTETLAELLHATRQPRAGVASASN